MNFTTINQIVSEQCRQPHKATINDAPSVIDCSIPRSHIPVTVQYAVAAKRPGPVHPVTDKEPDTMPTPLSPHDQPVSKVPTWSKLERLTAQILADAARADVNKEDALLSMDYMLRLIQLKMQHDSLRGVD